MPFGRRFPFLRARVASDGALRLVPKPDLAPWEASEAWWQAVLAGPRPALPRRRAFEPPRLRLRDLDDAALRPLSTRPAHTAKRKTPNLWLVRGSLRLVGTPHFCA